jgi:hypothetical protein
MTSDASGHSATAQPAVAPSVVTQPAIDPAPGDGASGHARPITLGRLLRRGAWIGALAGAVAGPLVWITQWVTINAVAANNANAGFGDGNGWGPTALLYSLVWLMTPVGLFAALIGALVGVVVGMITAAIVVLALRFESRVGWRRGNVYLAVSGGLGGALALGIPLLLGGLVVPGVAFVVGQVWFVLPVVVLGCALLAVAQRKQLAPLRQRAEHMTPRADYR